MSKLHDRFANFLSEIEQMEKDNEKLTEDIQQLEKEKTDGYSKFNTETHALIKEKNLKAYYNKLKMLKVIIILQKIVQMICMVKRKK